MDTPNSVRQGEMDAPKAEETYRERCVRLQLERLLKKWGKYESIQRFARKYGRATTKAAYLSDLDLYFRWLKSEGVSLDPDELIRDNLKCVYGSKPEAVHIKRKHTDLLDRYANKYLADREIADCSRRRKAAAVRVFYTRNDSPLFGDFMVSEGKPDDPRKALKAEDIREVLKALPVQQRAPLVLMWQSGIEIGSILGLTWGKVNLEGRFLKLDFSGRKRHKKAYFTFAGKDTVLLLKILRQKRIEDFGREPSPEDLIFLGKGKRPIAGVYLNSRFKLTALRLHKQGIISNGQPGAWRVYALRHSFETEASHAGVKAEIRDFFLGHLRGIQWTYNHRDELHPEDLEKEYAKIEPLVSLEPDKAIIEAGFEEREKSLLKRVESAEALLAELKKELGVSQTAPPQSARLAV